MFSRTSLIELREVSITKNGDMKLRETEGHKSVLEGLGGRWT